MKYLPVFLILFACSALPFDHPIENTYNGYVIEKGNNHASNRIFLPKDGRTLRFDAILFPDTWYAAKDSAIHKIYGFTDANSTVHKNSLRFGFRANNHETLDIFAYWYVDGKMGYKWMGETKTDIENSYELEVSDNHYKFRFNNARFSVERSKDITHGVRARLFPYFEDGKGNGAYHDMTFYIFEYK